MMTVYTANGGSVLMYGLVFVVLLQCCAVYVSGQVFPLPTPSSPTIVSTTPQSTSITTTWTQPEGDVVDSYEITYSYQGPCLNAVPPLTMTTNESTIREDTVTGLEEFSDYLITVTAVNRAGRSDATSVARTLSAAPSGPPKSLALTSISQHNVTIQWNPVDCLDRNGDITVYRVRYGLTSRTERETRLTDENTRMFTVTGFFWPRTTYTFEVEAFNVAELLIGPTASIAIVTPPSERVSLLLNGVLYGNNSIVTLDEIGVGSAALFCLTSKTDCCRFSDTPAGVGEIGDWFYPNGSKVYFFGGDIYRGRGRSFVHLLRRNNAQAIGVFRCVVPDASGTNQQIYVGVYPENSGSPSIASLLYNRSTLILTCTSTGGPATTVTWRKNGAVVEVDGTTYSQSKQVIDSAMGTYNSQLTFDDQSSAVGNFYCTVSNSRGTTPMQGPTVSGVEQLPFTVGSAATLSCSDSAASSIEWLDSMRRVVEMTTSQQQLDLTFNPVNDSIHNTGYSCRVTRRDGTVVEQIVILNVTVPSGAIQATITTSAVAIAGQQFSLNCVVSETIVGLTNTPVAVWSRDGTLLRSENEFTVTSSANDTVATSVLTFTSLSSSDAGVYTCSGTLESSMDLVTEDETIQVYVPMVTISTPSPTPYAGTPLTLTCEVNLGDDVSREDVTSLDVTWSREGFGVLSNTTPQVVISPSVGSGSGSVYRSTLSITPLKTMDSFTCSVTISTGGGLVSNAAGMDMADIQARALPSPEVVISGPESTTAGQTYSFTCTVTTVDDLFQPPTVQWFRRGSSTSLTNDTMDISVGPTRVSGNVASVDLMFDPLHTSFGGEYICRATIDIEDIGIVPVVNSETQVVRVQISDPDVRVVGVPVNGGFFTGQQLNLTCRVKLDETIDSDVTVTTTWFRGGMLLDDTNRTRIIPAEQSDSNPLLYESIVVFNPLGQVDAGVYECGVDVTPNNATYIIPSNTTTPRTVEVGVFPTPVIRIAPFGDTVPGSMYSLDCNVTIVEEAEVTVEWLTSNEVVSDDSITVNDQESYGLTTARILTFDPLQTSHGAVYYCRVTYEIESLNVTEDAEENVTVSVNFPPPTVSLERDREGSLVAGTPLTLTCTSVLMTTGINTPYLVETNIIGLNQTAVPPRVDLEETRQQSETMLNITVVASFYVLTEFDDGIYSCRVTVRSNGAFPFVISSEQTRPLPTIDVTALPTPQVVITSTGDATAGQPYTLTCTATVIENLVVPPTVEWLIGGQSVSNSNGIVVEPTEVSGVNSSRVLRISTLRSSHGGQYTCRARIDIPEADLLVVNTQERDVHVQFPVVPVDIRTTTLRPIHGTSFVFTCNTTLSEFLNTDHSVSIEWLRNDVPVMSDGRVSVSHVNKVDLKYSGTLTFNPLGNNSVDGGTYTCRISVTHLSGNEAFIDLEQGEGEYTVSVEAAPPPTIQPVETERLNNDGCERVAMLTCTATVVENFAVLPNITWLDSENQEVQSGNNDVTLGEPGELIFNDVTQNNMGDYKCRACVTIEEVGIVDLCNRSVVTVSNTAPVRVQELICTGDSSSELRVTWRESQLPDQELVQYKVEVLKYVQDAMRRVSTTSLTPQYNETVEQNTASIYRGLEEFVPYDVSVRAANLRGCGDAETKICFTQEGEPSMAPMNVTATRLNDTAMNVSWTPLTLVEARGFVKYVITYMKAGGSRKRQSPSPKIVNGTDSSCVVNDLEPGVEYDVTVGAQTGGGTNATSVKRVGTGRPPPDTPAIVGAVIAVILVVVLTILIVIIVLYIVKRYKRSGGFQPKTKGMYSPTSPTHKSGVEEMGLRSLSPVDLSNEKGNEAAAELQQSALSTEVMDRMKSISVRAFRDHVFGMHDERDKGFETEYQSFPADPVASHDIAKLPHNRPKNRFANIFPYDTSRVTLNEIRGEEGSDYINACTMDGHKRSQCYIAAQGPMPNTVGDFWRMVWEKRMPSIVMLTKCTEAGRRKCEQYWAENYGEEYVPPDKKLTITTTSIMPFADFVIRTFTVRNNVDPGAEQLKVTQYHFTSWPDHGVPKFATSLISFIRRVQKGHNKDSNRELLVHCSAGVGRTGTFITLDTMLERIRQEDSVNVYAFVHNMRQRRVLMVQTLAQYVFIHDALNELITCGETDIPASTLRTKVNLLSKVKPGRGITGYANQFDLLEQVSRKPEEEDCTDAQEHFNMKKNRYPDKIPYNMSRARLRPTGEDGSEYINASFIDGYKQRNAYIATQGPLKYTVNDLWRMMYEFKSKTLVVVCNMNEDGEEAAYPFWPSKEDEPTQYGKLVVTLQSKSSYNDFHVRKFLVREDKGQGSPKSEGFVLTQFHHTDWSCHGNPNPGVLIEMLDMITKNQMNTGNRPITVMCNDGVGRSGTFICIHSQLERLKTEGVVDFFQAIKSARIQRAGLIPEVSQYAFCHEVLADYIDKFDNYANFKDMI